MIGTVPADLAQYMGHMLRTAGLRITRGQRAPFPRAFRRRHEYGGLGRNMGGMSVEQALLSFAVVAALLTIIPGLDTILVLRAAIVQGRLHGYATALGINAGAMAWGAAAHRPCWPRPRTPLRCSSSPAPRS